MPNNRNRYNLQTATFTPGVFQPAVFKPEQEDIGLLANSLTRMEERERTANEKLSAMDIAFSQMRTNLHQDPETLKWFDNFTRNYKNRVQSYAQLGDYGNAINSAVRLAGEATNDPSLQGRIRANKKYEQFVNSVLNQNLDADTRDWALDQNPYHYEDIKDSKGNIIGGTEWEPTRRPVDTYDLFKLGSSVLAQLKPEKSQGESFTFVDANGNITQDWRQAVDVVKSVKGTIEKLGKDKLKAAIKQAISMTPEAKDYIYQKYDVDLWKYKKTKDKDNVENPAVYEDGRIKTRDEYLDGIIDPWDEINKYTYYTSNTSFGSGMQTAMALKAQKGLLPTDDDDIQMPVNILSTKGHPILVTSTMSYGLSESKLKDAVVKVETIAPAIRQSRQWNEAKKNNDYQGMIKALRQTQRRNADGSVTGYISSLSEDKQNAIIDEIRNIRNYGSQVRGFKNVNKNRDVAAIDFGNALDAGTGLPANNPYTKTVNRIVNQFNKGKAASRYEISFSNKNDLLAVLKELNLNESTAEAAGIDIKSKNGDDVLSFAANNANMFKLIGSAVNRRSSWGRMFPIFSSDIKLTSFDDTNTPITSNVQLGMLGIYSGNQHSIDALGRYIKNANNARQRVLTDMSFPLNTTRELTVIEDPEITRLKSEGGTGLETRLNEHRKVVKDMLLSHSLSQGAIYKYDNNTGALVALTPREKAMYDTEFKAYVNSDLSTINFATDGELSGAYIEISPNYDKKNDKITSKSHTYFLPGVITDEATQAFDRDTKTQAQTEFTKRRSIGGTYQNKLREVITDINDVNPIINGKRSTVQNAISVIEVDKLIDDFAERIHNNIIKEINTGRIRTQEQVTSNTMKLIERYSTVIANETNRDYQDVVEALYKTVKNGR